MPSVRIPPHVAVHRPFVDRQTPRLQDIGTQLVGRDDATSKHVNLAGGADGEPHQAIANLRVVDPHLTAEALEGVRVVLGSAADRDPRDVAIMGGVEDAQGHRGDHANLRRQSAAGADEREGP